MDHSRAWLSPVMVLEIALDRTIGMVRAVADVVDMRALIRKFLAHPVVEGAEIVLGEKAARHAGLIGEKEHKIAGVVEPADRLCRVRHPADALARAHVAVVVVDHAVAIEERGGLRCGARLGPAHFRGASRIMACSIASQMPWASARWICWMTGVSSLGATRR